MANKLTTTELELHSSLTLGTLTSNAEAIRDIVKAKLKDYTPENYIGKVDEAKSDRAILNNAEKALNSKRLELERSYMEPFNQFKNTINETCKAIKMASSGLDEIVKAEEERERESKKWTYEQYWKTSGFTLFDFERIYQKSWTNKTTKQKDVFKELDAIQEKTFSDLKILEKFPAEDVPLLKTVYLDTLDLNQAMQKAESLKANKERLAREKIEQEQIKTRKAIEGQQQEEIKEINDSLKQDSDETLVSEALGLEIEQQSAEVKETYALILKGTRDQLLSVRREITKAGVTYTKLENKGNGVYTVTE